MNNCFLCKGDMVEQRCAYMVEFESGIVIIKNVPTLVCQQCGTRAYTDEVAEILESLVAKARGLLTEITVINYPKAA